MAPAPDSQDSPNTISSSLRSDSKWLALLFLLASAFLIPTFLGYVYCRSDLKLLFYPWHEFVRNALLKGELPLWDPTIMCGVPFLASNPPAALFYPLRFILYPLEYHIAVSAYIVIHLFVAGVSLFYFLKSYRLRASSCFFGGVSFMYAPYLIGRIPYLAEFTLLCLAPLALWLTKYVCETKSARAVALGSMAYACMHFVGQPQLLYPISVIMGLFWLDFLVRDFKRGTPLRRTCLFAFPSMVVLGTLMAGVVLIPFLEFVMHSDRAEGLSYSQFAARSLPLYGLLGIVLPNPFGASSIEALYPNWERLQRCLIPYLGVIPLIMAFYSGKLKRVKYLVPLLLLLLWAVGGNWGWFELFYKYVPGLKFMRIPERTLPLACLLLTVYSAFGFEKFMDALESKRIRGAAFAVPACILIVLSVCGAALLLMNPRVSVALIKALQTLGYSSIIEHTVPAIAQTVLLFSLFSLLTALAVKGTISHKGTGFALIFLTIINLFPNSLETQFLTEKKFLYSVRDIWDSELSFVRGDESPETRIFLSFRRVGAVGLQLEPELTPNVGQIHNDVLNAAGYNCQLLQRFAAMTKPIAQSGPAKARILSLLGVKYYFGAADEKPLPRWRLAYEPSEETEYSFVVFRNPACVPRIHFVRDFKVVDSEEQILHQLSSPDFDPLKTVIIEKEMKDFSAGTGDSFRTDVTAIDSGLNHVRIEVSSNAECLLVLSDTYYPGWKARVNGNETEIYRGNLLFRVIHIPRGFSTVTFEYTPLSFAIGGAISIAAGLVCLLLLVDLVRTRRNP